jgi:hypothetical protein
MPGSNINKHGGGEASIADRNMYLLPDSNYDIGGRARYAY